jgi:hypothetical protein
MVAYRESVRFPALGAINRLTTEELLPIEEEPSSDENLFDSLLPQLHNSLGNRSTYPG